MQFTESFKNGAGFGYVKTVSCPIDQHHHLSVDFFRDIEGKITTHTAITDLSPYRLRDASPSTLMVYYFDITVFAQAMAHMAEVVQILEVEPIPA